MCIAQYSLHDNTKNVLVVPISGGFGPKPLDEAVTVSYTSATPMDEESQHLFEVVLESIPVPQLHEQIIAAIEDEKDVTVHYRPGSAEVHIKVTDTEINKVSCEWELEG